MKSSISLKVNIFEDQLNVLEALYQKYIADENFKQFTKWYFTLWVYSFIKKLAKENKKMILSEEKNRKKAKQCYHNNIYRWKMDRFSSEVEITRGII